MRWLSLVALGLAFVGAPQFSSPAQAAPGDSEEQIKKLEAENQQLRNRLQGLEQALKQRGGPPPRDEKHPPHEARRDAAPRGPGGDAKKPAPQHDGWHQLGRMLEHRAPHGFPGRPGFGPGGPRGPQHFGLHARQGLPGRPQFHGGPGAPSHFGPHAGRDFHARAEHARREYHSRKHAAHNHYHGMKHHDGKRDGRPGDEHHAMRHDAGRDGRPDHADHHHANRRDGHAAPPHLAMRQEFMRRYAMMREGAGRGPERDARPDSRRHEARPSGPDHRPPADRGPEARRPEGRGPEARRPEGRGPEVRRPEGRGPEVRRPDSRGPAARGPDGRGPEGRESDRRGPEAGPPRGVGPRDGARERKPDGVPRDEDRREEKPREPNRREAPSAGLHSAPVEQPLVRQARTTFDINELFELVELLDRSAALGLGQ